LKGKGKMKLSFKENKSLKINNKKQSDKVVIYFNQWFSSITDVIVDIKEKLGDRVYIVASSTNPNHAYKNVVDKFIVEDWKVPEDGHLSEKQVYIKWLLKALEDNDVDIFFAKKKTNYIIQYMDRIEDLGIATVLEAPETIKLFDSKVDVYDRLKNNPKVATYIPNYARVEELRDAENIVDVHSNKAFKQWCLKLDTDEGGASFRKIEQNPMDLSSLKKFRTNAISKSDAIELVKSISETGKGLRQLIFMEMLDSPEISVDCYNSMNNGFDVICRAKGATREQRIYTDNEITEVCKAICEEYQLEYPFNVQFRHEQKTGNLKLLEINPRLSGGSYYYIPFGINIALHVLYDMLDIEHNMEDNIKALGEKYITHSEHVVVL
jgi:hypothetical protein